MATQDNSLTGLYQALQIQIDEGKTIESPACQSLIKQIQSKHHIFDQAFLGKKIVSQWDHPKNKGNFVLLEDDNSFYWVDSIIKDKDIKGKVTEFAEKHKVSRKEVYDYIMEIVHSYRLRKVNI